MLVGDGAEEVIDRRAMAARLDDGTKKVWIELDELPAGAFCLIG
jgi:hypothetical protein